MLLTMRNRSIWLGSLEICVICEICGLSLLEPVVRESPVTSHRGRAAFLRGDSLCGYLNGLQIAFDQSVAQANDATSMIGNLLFMGHHHNRVAGFIQYFQERHNLFSGP
jgi:hypothetical protein